jgi:hypothetical protein
MHYLLLQGQRVRGARSQQAERIYFVSFLLDLFFDPEEGGSTFL